MENEEIQNVERVEVTEVVEPAKKKFEINWYWVTCAIMTVFILAAAVVTIMVVARDANNEVVPAVTTESITEVTSVPETTETIPATEPAVEETIPETTPATETTIKETKPVEETKPKKKLTNQDKAEVIFKYITEELGYSEAVACGIIGNIAYETGWKFNPKAGTSSTRYGLIQWLGGRLTNLKKWCKNNGRDYNTIEGQMDFMDWELKNTNTYGTYEYLLECENNSQGAYDAGWYFCYWYERPNNKKRASNNRGKEAQKWYQALVVEADYE